MRFSPLVAAAALALLGAGGCDLAPGRTLPHVDTRPSWRGEAPDPNSLANVAWFDVYDDEVLRQLIRTAIQENPYLAIALARIDEARALARAAGAEIAPRVDLAASGGTVRSSRNQVPVGDRTTGTAAVSFDLSWEVDVFGRLRNQARAASALYFASVEAHRDVGIRLVADVARAYFELRELDELLAITEKTVGASDQYRELARVRFEGGKTSEIDWRQAESEYYRTDSFRVEFLRQIAAKENEISVLLGRAPNAVPRGRPALGQSMPVSVPAGLPSDLLQRRPDIAAAEQVLYSETALVGAARANLYPRIALTGSYGWESDSLSDLFKSSSVTSSLIAGLLQPVFDAGRNRAAVEARCARMRIAMEDYRRIVLAAFGEVESSLVSFRRFGERRGVEEQRVESLRKVLELAETRYVGGVSQYLEVIDAQRALFDAELDRADVIRAHLVSLTALYKALGGGWDPSLYGQPGMPLAGAPCGCPPVVVRPPGG